MFLAKRMCNIKNAMRIKHFTQKKIAKKLDLSESYITRLINGERYSKKFEIFIATELGINYRRLH
jgi:transcriptional regulator with XRE-family HTH domain